MTTTPTNAQPEPPDALGADLADSGLATALAADAGGQPGSDSGAEPAADISGHVKHLTLAGERHVWLLGTAHVSRASVEEAQALIRRLRPAVVAIELCPARHQALIDPDRWKKLDIFQVFREGRSLLLLANLAVGAWQRRIGSELGVEPGAEMLAAAEAAREVGARLELIDRDIHITLKRTWGSISLWQQATLLAAISGSLIGGETVSAEEIESMKEGDQLSDMLSEFSRVLPQVAGPLIHERDRYMARKITDLEAESLVAVVGAAHLPGMVASLDSGSARAVQIADLEQLPKPGWFWRAAQWLLPAAVVVALAVAWQLGDIAMVGDLVWIWIAATGVPAALFSAIAGGRPLSILAAGLFAPFAALHPMVGTAMLVGPVEAWLRKPTVADCERIADDVQSLGGLYRNPFTRVLLVATASALGTALGAWIAGALMARTLAGAG